MENVYSFEPFWSRRDVQQSPTKAIEDIQKRAAALYLHHHKRHLDETGKFIIPSIRDTIYECMAIIRVLTKNTDDENTIIKRISQTTEELKIDRMRIVYGAMAMWYASAAPVFARPCQGNPPGVEEVNENGETTLRYNREAVQEKQKHANLGLVAFLIAYGQWATPKNILLKEAILMSKSVGTVMYLVFLLIPEMPNTDWVRMARDTRPPETFGMYMRSIWSLGRENFDFFDVSGPGAEFGATLDEVKLTSEGTKLLTNIGRGENWYVPPLSHPLRQTPGTPWSKFLRNHNQPVFGPPSDETTIRYRWPSSLDTILAPYKEAYANLRDKFDARGIPRPKLSEEALKEQFKRLAKATGEEYPNVEPSENTAAFVDEPEQEFLYHPPMAKMPIADLHGNLTFPFINSALRAVNFREDPDEVEPDFRVYTMEHKQDENKEDTEG